MIIKFRAWYNNKELLAVDTIFFDGDKPFVYLRKDGLRFGQGRCPVVLEQFTGKKCYVTHSDLYVGDIVEFSYCNNVHKAEIVYNIKTCGFELRYVTVVGAYGERAVHSLNFANIENIKVIGNKHENPELLGGKV